MLKNDYKLLKRLFILFSCHFQLVWIISMYETENLENHRNNTPSNNRTCVFSDIFYKKKIIIIKIIWCQIFSFIKWCSLFGTNCTELFIFENIRFLKKKTKLHFFKICDNNMYILCLKQKYSYFQMLAVLCILI